MKNAVKKDEIVIKNFKQLKVWERAVNFAVSLYGIARNFPKFEEYNLKSQLLRAATSVSANLAEGNGTIFPKKELSFYDNAKCSLDEVRGWLEIAKRLGYIDEQKFTELDNEAIEINKIIIGLMRKILRKDD